MPSFHGPQRVIAEGRVSLRAAQYETKLHELHERHRRELLAAGFFHRLLLQWRLRREARRCVDSHMPSGKSLFLRQS